MDDSKAYQKTPSAERLRRLPDALVRGTELVKTSQYGNPMTWAAAKDWLKSVWRRSGEQELRKIEREYEEELRKPSLLRRFS